MRLKALLSLAVLALVALVVAACGSSGPASTLESTPTPTSAPATPTSTSVSPTPTLTIVPPTPTPAPDDTPRGTTLRFGCEEHRGRMGLMVSADEAEAHAVITSYECSGAHVDSTGISPSRSPALVIPNEAPLEVRLDADQDPVAVDVRLYAGAGKSGYFFRWPEEFPGGSEPVDKFEPAPSLSFQYLPPVPPGQYSLVVRATWEGPIDVFYAISFELR